MGVADGVYETETKKEQLRGGGRPGDGGSETGGQ